VLILHRREGETVWITASNGEQIEVTVAEVRGGRARLGFHAPESVVIDRGEVHAEKLRYRQEAEAELRRQMRQGGR